MADPIQVFFGSLSALGTLWNAWTNYSNRFEKLPEQEQRVAIAQIIDDAEAARIESENRYKRIRNSEPGEFRILQNRIPEIIIYDLLNGIEMCWNRAHATLKSTSSTMEQKTAAVESARECACQHIQLLLLNFGGRAENLPDGLSQEIADWIKQAGCNL